MGINLEMVRFVMEQRRFGNFPNDGAVIGLGAQDVCVAPDVIMEALGDSGAAYDVDTAVSANSLYRRLGDHTHVDRHHWPE